MTVSGANPNPTWNHVVNALVSDAANQAKLQNIKELTGKERKVLLEALQNNMKPNISDADLKNIYDKLTKTTDFKRTTSIRAKISRALQNMAGTRISSVKFSEEVLKSQRVVEPLSNEAMDVITGYLTRNLKSKDKDGNLHPLTWENTPQGMKAKLPAGHALKVRFGLSPKLYSQKTEEDGSSSVIVSKYAALWKRFDGGEWLGDSDSAQLLESPINFLKEAFEKVFSVKTEGRGEFQAYDFSQVGKEKVQEYLQTRFPDFDNYELTEQNGTTTLEITIEALALFKEFQMPKGRGMEFIEKE